MNFKHYTWIFNSKYYTVTYLWSPQRLLWMRLLKGRIIINIIFNNNMANFFLLRWWFFKFFLLKCIHDFVHIILYTLRNPEPWKSFSVHLELKSKTKKKNFHCNNLHRPFRYYYNSMPIMRNHSYTYLFIR